MGYDYVLVYASQSLFSFPAILLNFSPSHLRYTIPPAIVLTYCYRPLCTALDVYKILFLIAVSFR